MQTSANISDLIQDSFESDYRFGQIVNAKVLKIIHPNANVLRLVLDVPSFYDPAKKIVHLKHKTSVNPARKSNLMHYYGKHGWIIDHHLVENLQPLKGNRVIIKFVHGMFENHSWTYNVQHILKRLKNYRKIRYDMRFDNAPVYQPTRDNGTGLYYLRNTNQYAAIGDEVRISPSRKYRLAMALRCHPEKLKWLIHRLECMRTNVKLSHSQGKTLLTRQHIARYSRIILTYSSHFSPAVFRYPLRGFCDSDRNESIKSDRDYYTWSLGGDLCDLSSYANFWNTFSKILGKKVTAKDLNSHLKKLAKRYASLCYTSDKTKKMFTAEPIPYHRFMRRITKCITKLKSHHFFPPWWYD